jgi:hypothetical protein
LVMSGFHEELGIGLDFLRWFAYRLLGKERYPWRFEITWHNQFGFT